MPVELHPFPFSHRHTQWDRSVHCVLTSLWRAPVAAKKWPPPRHLARAVLTKSPFVPLITGPFCCPPSFSRVLGWLLSLSALLHRVCVFHLLNGSISQDPRVAFVFSLVMCSMGELIPSPDILSTVIYRESPSLSSGWMFLTGHPSTPTVHVYYARVSCDHGLEINLSSEQQANSFICINSFNRCSDYIVGSVIPILQMGK